MDHISSCPEILPATMAGIARAAWLLQQGKLVAFGTETVYGLGADATQSLAVQRLYQAKGRPAYNPLISHFPSANVAFRYGKPSALAKALADAFWPGPLTLILPLQPNSPISPLALAHLATIAVRVPDVEAIQTLLSLTDRPIVAPSANPSGRISPTTSAHVLNTLGDRVDAILDTGPARIGVESSIVDVSSEQAYLLRPGGISLEELNAASQGLGRILPAQKPEQNAMSAPSSIIAPGQLTSHYAPTLPVRLNATHIQPNEAQLAFGRPLPGGRVTYNLSPSGSLAEAARNLFSALHDLDKEGQSQNVNGIAVMPIPHTQLGLAINDRLKRAAAPKENHEPA
ncbi:Threonylcarbamoyl-AMP synthase [Entomobacter blattae]|uniref:Threonylcarbamoyl-AMP synthase n=2 Tax=Entomobacter blattae TaxID=2762277 RepID=A0A7H1NV07_9PROT|nr:Threonylcarbamoyl-AMP synthase [Entomobacter blattae]